MMRVGPNPNYVTDVLPAILVFGLGLSATVAPLTATALNSVPEHQVGIASGINNGVSRVAGLLAIAVLGALIAGSFSSTIDDKLAGTQLVSEGADPLSTRRRTRPWGRRHRRPAAKEAAAVDDAGDDASAHAFHLGLAAGGILMIVGGVIAGIGLRNPRRETEYEAPGAAPAGECAHCPDHLEEGRRPGAASRSRSPRRLRRWPIFIHEARELIESDRLAHMVTLNPDGSPQVSCIWVGMDGDEIVSGHLPRNQKVKNVERDGRVAISIETDTVRRHGPPRVPGRPWERPRRGGRRGRAAAAARARLPGARREVPAD